jgi:hypothetical protein
VLHQSLEGGEGDPGRDVIAPFVQGADLIVLDYLSLAGDILHRQGEGTWSVNRCRQEKVRHGDETSGLGRGLHFNTLKWVHPILCTSSINSPFLHLKSSS